MYFQWVYKVYCEPKNRWIIKYKIMSKEKGYRIEQQIDELLNTKLWVKKKDFAMYAEQK